MTYHITPQPLQSWPTPGLQGFGAFGAVEVPSPCVQWITSHYHPTEFERIRTQELPQLLADAPRLNALVGMPLPWSAFGAEQPGMIDPARAVTIHRRGASGLFGLGASITGGGAVSARSDEGRLAALQRREYAEFTAATALWLQRVVNAFNRMGLALNLPTSWLLPSNPNTVRTAASPAADQIIVDFTDPVPPPAMSYGRIEGTDRVSAETLCPGFPVTVHWRNLPFSLLHATLSGTKPDTWYGKSPTALHAFWQKFMYDNTPQSPRNRAGYPAEARHGYTIDIPPVAATVASGGGGLAAEAGWSRCKLFAGPVYALWYAKQYLSIISSRSVAQVLGNAFETWASVLTVWADAPANTHSTTAKDKMKTAAAGLKLAATGFTSAGAVATASGAGAVAGIPMMVFGAAMTAFSEIVKILPAARATMSSCTGDKATNAALRISLHTTLGFCGPPTPLMFNPPDGCKPTDALTFVGGGGLPTRDKSLWDQLRPYLTHPVTLGAVGLVAALGAYRVFAPKPSPNTRRQRQRRLYLRHNRGI